MYYNKFTLISLYTILTILVIISLYPFYWLIINASYDTSGVYAFPPHMWFGDHTMINFKNLNESVGIVRVFYNTVIISIVGTSITLTISVMSGYSFAKFHFRFKNAIFAIFIFSMMIPYQATMISLFSMFANADLMDTYTALIIPGLCNIFTVFLVRQSLTHFPEELLDAGRMDGANELWIFLKIVLPNIKPTLAAAGIFIFMGNWNNFMWPLIITSQDDMKTLPVALSTLKGADMTDYGQIVLGIAITTIPIMIVFLLLSRHFISNMLSSGTKG